MLGRCRLGKMLSFMMTGEVLDGKFIQVNTSRVNGEVRINCPDVGETNQVRAPPSSLAAKPARFEGRCSQSILTRPRFVFCWTWVGRSLSHGC